MPRKNHKVLAVTAKNIDTDAVLVYTDGEFTGDNEHELRRAHELDDVRPMVRVGAQPVDLAEADEPIRASAILLTAMRGRGVLIDHPTDLPWTVATEEETPALLEER